MRSTWSRSCRALLGALFLLALLSPAWATDSGPRCNQLRAFLDSSDFSCNTSTGILTLGASVLHRGTDPFIVPTLYGDDQPSGTLTLKSTTDATKGTINVYDAMKVGTSFTTISSGNISPITFDALTSYSGGNLRLVDMNPTVSVTAGAPNVNLMVARGTWSNAAGTDPNNALTYAMVTAKNGMTYSASGGVPPFLPDSFTDGHTSTVASGTATDSHWYDISFLDFSTISAAASASYTMSTTNGGGGHASLYSSPTLTAGSGGTLTMDARKGIWIADVTKTGTGTISLANNIGVDCDNLTGGTSNACIRSAGVASGTARYFLYEGTSAPSIIGGKMTFGSTTLDTGYFVSIQNSGLRVIGDGTTGDIMMGAGDTSTSNATFTINSGNGSGAKPRLWLERNGGIVGQFMGDGTNLVIDPPTSGSVLIRPNGFSGGSTVLTIDSSGRHTEIEAALGSTPASGSGLYGVESGAPNRFYYKNESGNVWEMGYSSFTGSSAICTTSTCTDYIPIMGNQAASQATEASVVPRIRAPGAIHLIGMTCAIDAAVGASKSRTFSVMANGSAVTNVQGCAISGASATSCTVFPATTDAVASGLPLTVRDVESGASPGGTVATCTVYFTVDAF